MAALCISMHQPWASLLVHGIKRVEGRAWPTEHRGTLWVHATAQAPEPDVVAVRCPARQCVLTPFAHTCTIPPLLVGYPLCVRTAPLAAVPVAAPRPKRTGTRLAGQGQPQ